ncbi:hypothetical protein HYV10_04035 [Candidatus Dependentiae bacterium]|nr:hypothetical protein [Candidatus Dependentiae bacterium]
MIPKKASKLFLIPALVGIFFIILFSISVITLWRSSRINFDELIHQEVMQLKETFERIQHDCYIYNFEHERNYIDFLNVVKFSNSHVGSMELGFPQNWKGPYLKKNPRIQNKLYTVLKNKQGYFIVPGDGIRLANGKVIGKDLVLDKNSDMKHLMFDFNGLASSVGVLAAEIKIGSEFVKNMTQYKWEMLSAMD